MWYHFLHSLRGQNIAARVAARAFKQISIPHLLPMVSCNMEGLGCECWSVEIETMYPGSQETRRSSYTLAADELGAVNPRRGSSSAKVSLFEQNCEKCNSFRPRIKEFISMIQKFETSLGPFGPYQEIHEHVSNFYFWRLSIHWAWNSRKLR